MPRRYPSEFRFRAATLVRVDKPITTAACELGLSAPAFHSWVRQGQVDQANGQASPEQNLRS
ncbi:transposase [Rhodococcus qingshengii]|nr:transposase [Rhodococcus qingshengii]